MKLRICAIYQLETYFVMAKTTAISSVSKTINRLNIQYDFHVIYKQKSYTNKQDEIDSFYENNVPILNYIDNPALIE